MFSEVNANVLCQISCVDDRMSTTQKWASRHFFGRNIAIFRSVCAAFFLAIHYEEFLL